MKALRFIVSVPLVFLAGQAWAEKPAPVTVTNTPLPVNVINTTLPVSVVNQSSTVNVGNPADIAKALGVGTPVHYSIPCDTVPGILGSCVTTFSPPSASDKNTRVIFEYASAECFIEPSSGNMNFVRVVTRLNGQPTTHWLNVSDHVGGHDVPGVDNIFSLGHAVRFSHDWGAADPITIQVAYTNDPATNFRIHCSIELDGQRISS